MSPAPAPIHQPQGSHWLVDMYALPASAPLGDPAALEACLHAAARTAGATPLSGHFHLFGPGQGVTGVLLLQESHISIHTWPETGFAALDVFMCGKARPGLAVDHLLAALAPGRHEVRVVARGG